MNKAELERALKRVTGMALKKVVVNLGDDLLSDIDHVYFDEALGCVVIVPASTIEA